MARESYHNNNIAFIEASTKENININEIFLKLIDIMLNINSSKSKPKIGHLKFYTKVLINFLGNNQILMMNI